MGLASLQYAVHPASTLPFGENGGGADKDQHGGRTSRRRGFVVDPAALVSGVEDASRSNPQALVFVCEQQLHAPRPQSAANGETRSRISRPLKGRPQCPARLLHVLQSYNAFTENRGWAIREGLCQTIQSSSSSAQHPHLTASSKLSQHQVRSLHPSSTRKRARCLSAAVTESTSDEGNPRGRTSAMAAILFST